MPIEVVEMAERSIIISLIVPMFTFLTACATLISSYYVAKLNAKVGTLEKNTNSLMAAALKTHGEAERAKGILEGADAERANPRP